MSVDQTSTRPPEPPGAKLVKYHDYIDGKIESTRRMVKVIDLATALVALAVAVLLFLLVVAVAEHWLVRGGLSVGARWVFFAGIAAYVVYFAYRRLWPLLARAINPVYAAQAIEHGSPSLKNSLINLLMFRERRSDISEAVYRTLEEQAARGLTRVQVDTAVDQSPLIRLGYLLITVVAIAALYKVLSPKDPFIAAERVLMPWADIVPASRVTISEIKPGMTTISRGEFLDVSADVRGLKDEDTVVLRYTTDDGQAGNRQVAMKHIAGGQRYECRLRDDAGGSESSGVTRNLTYWLEAGDARTLNYGVTVVPAATILVERVDYDFPEYTAFVDRTVDGVGDIRAIEGTRVTVHARANGPIRDASVDFDADGRRDLSMTAKEQNAEVAFTLELRDDRRTPKHASYVLRFTNDEGRQNHDPVKHAISVEPDLAPEAEIRVPQEKSRDARVDEAVTIEVQASDPDFALAAVRLRGEVGGRSVLDERLLAAQHRGQFSGRYVLTPRAKGLKPGDVLEYWVEADDIRAPKPNTFATERKVLRILSVDPAQQPPPNQVAQNDRQQRQPGGDQNQGRQAQQGQGQQGAGDRGQNAGEQQRGKLDQNGENRQNQKNRGEGKNQGNSAQQGESGGQAKNDDGKDKKSPNSPSQNPEGGSQNGDSNSQSGNDQSGKQFQPGEPNGDGKQGEQQQPTGKGESNGAASGESRPGSDKNEAGKQGDAQPSDVKGKHLPRGDEQGAKQKGNEGTKDRAGDKSADSVAAEEQSPVSANGDNDAEAFNRIQKHLERSGELKPESESSNEAHKESTSEPDKVSQPQDGKRPGEQKDSTQKEQQPGDRQGNQQSEQSKKEMKPGQGQDRQGTRQNEVQKGADPKGDGAQTRGDDRNQKQEQSNEGQQQEKSPGGEQTSTKGSAGKGDEQKTQGAPHSRPDMQPKDKPPQSPSHTEKTDAQEPPAPANGKRESDSHGESGGDKSGGGEEGGGQKSPHAGTGSSGQNQSADNGAGQSAEKGKGENSSDGGQNAKSDRPTGSSDGKTPGKGSDQKNGTGDKPGGGDKQPGRDGERSADDKARGGDEAGKQGEKQAQRSDTSQPGKQTESQKGGQPGEERGQNENKQDSSHEGEGGGSSGGSGQPGSAVNPQPSITGEAPKGDDANLEYARKQTDLVVEKLADKLKQKKVDDGLLKDLGWSQEDLQRFVERWQQRKSAAEQPSEAGEAARRELDDALRSLGLRRGELQQNAMQKDTMRDLREGYRGPVPTEYKERVRAYNQGVSRARGNAE